VMGHDSAFKQFHQERASGWIGTVQSGQLCAISACEGKTPPHT
jgi:hypothetical protein